jgi:hypothetical protein
MPQVLFHQESDATQLSAVAVSANSNPITLTPEQAEWIASVLQDSAFQSFLQMYLQQWWYPFYKGHRNEQTLDYYMGGNVVLAGMLTNGNIIPILREHANPLTSNEGLI